MLYGPFELHNVTQRKELPGHPGLSLVRLPDEQPARTADRRRAAR